MKRKIVASVLFVIGALMVGRAISCAARHPKIDNSAYARFEAAEMVKP